MTDINDPQLKSIFVTAVANAVDGFAMTPQQVCELFALLAVEGFDEPIIETIPPHVKINAPYRERQHDYGWDNSAPHNFPIPIREREPEISDVV